MSIIFFKEKDGTINVHAAGYVTSEPKVYDKVVLFGLCYGKQKYLDCKAWRSDVTGGEAERLEKHDRISVDGVYKSYENKDGETKWQAELDSIFPVGVTSAAANSLAPLAQQNSADPLDTLGSRLQEYNEPDDDLPF